MVIDWDTASPTRVATSCPSAGQSIAHGGRAEPEEKTQGERAGDEQEGRRNRAQIGNVDGGHRKLARPEENEKYQAIAKRSTAPDSNWTKPTTGQRIELGTVSSLAACRVERSSALVTAVSASSAPSVLRIAGRVAAGTAPAADQGPSEPD